MTINRILQGRFCRKYHFPQRFLRKIVGFHPLKMDEQLDLGCKETSGRVLFLGHGYKYFSGVFLMEENAAELIWDELRAGTQLGCWDVRR